MSRTIVILHSNCWDGLVAAWSLGLDRQSTSYIPYDHSKPGEAELWFHGIAQQNPPSRVIAVDCFPEFIRGSAQNVVVIDHHESAQARIADRTGLNGVVFDTSHSAAWLAWEWGHPHEPVPVLNQFVEDRDLWKWEMNYSHEVNAYITTRPLTFEAWEWLQVEWRSKGPHAFAAKGRAILAAQAQVVNATVSKAGRWIFEGVPCAVVNCTAHISETGHALVDGTDTPIAFLWRIDGDTMSVSVRTHRDSPLKANEIAERFGGGGHPQAAGFHLPASWPLPWVSR